MLSPRRAKSILQHKFHQIRNLEPDDIESPDPPGSVSRTAVPVPVYYSNADDEDSASPEISVLHHHDASFSFKDSDHEESLLESLNHHNDDGRHGRNIKISDGSHDSEEGDGFADVSRDRRIDYEVFQWIFIISFTLIAVVDRYTTNYWPLWVDSPGPVIPGNVGVTIFSVVSWVSSRMLLVSSSYIFLFQNHVFWNWFTECNVVNKVMFSLSECACFLLIVCHRPNHQNHDDKL